MPADQYLIHIQPFFCSCGNSWTHSSVFHASNVGGMSRLEAVAAIDKSHEHIGISTLQPRKVPLCSLCATDVATAHNARADDQRRLWEEALARKQEDEAIAREELRAAAKPKPKGGSEPKPSSEPTLDQL